MGKWVPRECKDNISTSTTLIARIVGVNKSTDWRILLEERLFPYFLQRMQAVKAADYSRCVHFCHWTLEQNTLVTLDGIFNFHNSLEWVTSNSYDSCLHAFQEHFFVNVWSGIVNDLFIGSNLLPN